MTFEDGWFALCFDDFQRVGLLRSEYTEACTKNLLKTHIVDIQRFMACVTWAQGSLCLVNTAVPCCYQTLGNITRNAPFNVVLFVHQIPWLMNKRVLRFSLVQASVYSGVAGIRTPTTH
jgi:hypothetical protein